MNLLVRAAAGVLSLLAASAASAADADIVFLDQGAGWTAATRSDFYVQDQGSRMLPLAWLKSLKQPDGQPFLADSLARYGYLPNPASGRQLPVGFTASGPAGAEIVGMTCAACHTRQISVAGKSYRVDGGPAIVDFQSLLSDLDRAVGAVLASDDAFAGFAASALGAAAPDDADRLALRQSVEAWYLRYHTLMSRALPPAAWGPGRLDAVSMIFNRLTGLDLGPAPSFLIPENIRVADAPVRYPFLWNAALQDKTQWPGFADNGNDMLGLARNLGEVFGVFGVFEPRRDGLVVNFLNHNSANFDGLQKLEDLIRRIGKPRWPWKVDEALATKGAGIYQTAGCAECHGVKPGTERFLLVQTWATPVQNVGTDTREYDVLATTVSTGALRGAFIPFVTSPLKEKDLAFNVLATSVIGSIAEHTLSGGGGTGVAAALVASPAVAQLPALNRLPPALRSLEGAFRLQPRDDSADRKIFGMVAPKPATVAPPSHGAYESRVLEGIWATAPYLHNGSMPSLAELLKPASERVASFIIGPSYDIDNVGLSVSQTQFTTPLVTTDCRNNNSGNSRCGHEFGTMLPNDDKRALREYLKTL